MREGNNSILSNLAEGEILLSLPWSVIACVWLRVRATLCLCAYVGLCTCIFFYLRQIIESIIPLFDPLCEILDIAFSVEVPIGVSHTADNNRKLIWSWKSIVHMHALYAHFCSVPVGLSELHCKSVWFYEECRCKSTHSL